VELEVGAEPVEVRKFPLGRFEVYRVAGRTFGIARYEPRWRRSEHVGGDSELPLQT
jgi:hypothetical protein